MKHTTGGGGVSSSSAKSTKTRAQKTRKKKFSDHPCHRSRWICFFGLIVVGKETIGGTTIVNKTLGQSSLRYISYYTKNKGNTLNSELNSSEKKR